jgi:hypothetical protein
MAALFSIRSILSINAYSVVINFIFWFQNNHISSFHKPGKIFFQFVGFDLQTIGTTLYREVVKLLVCNQWPTSSRMPAPVFNG